MISPAPALPSQPPKREEVQASFTSKASKFHPGDIVEIIVPIRAKETGASRQICCFPARVVKVILETSTYDVLRDDGVLVTGITEDFLIGKGDTVLPMMSMNQKSEISSDFLDAGKSQSQSRPRLPKIKQQDNESDDREARTAEESELNVQVHEAKTADEKKSSKESFHINLKDQSVHDKANLQKTASDYTSASLVHVWN